MQLSKLAVQIGVAAVLAGNAWGGIPGATCTNTIKAEVVAFEQVFYYNRFGSFNPAGLMYALRHDVVPIDDSKDLRAGNVRLRDDKRPRPLVLRVNEGDCLEVTFWNYLSPSTPVMFPILVPKHALAPPNSDTRMVVYPSPESDYPATRAASMHVNGLDYVAVSANGGNCTVKLGNLPSDGAFVGQNESSLVPPNGCTKYKWFARREGGYFLFSTAATSGGEGDGGQIGLGLFGAVNVEPRGSVWYRSQVTHEQLKHAVDKADDYPNVDYDNPAIAMVDPKTKTIRHSDLNAIIYQPHVGTGKKAGSQELCTDAPTSAKCGDSFREFTVIFHDEITAVQAFAELADEQNPISSIKDGMAINYGTAGMGAPVLANLKRVGPGKDCAECKFEEFFLTSWVNGDPAMIVDRNKDGKAVKVLYPDDPSNVHHSYIGDPLRFRNIHAGPKETHVFHLHAHQWLLDKNDQNSTYLDSQTISPGASYTYDIQYGGSGNRNATVGDSIFHCHLYPHFAQGMWELWRSHDVFEDGSTGVWNSADHPRGRYLPDAEIAGGAPTPAVLPIPGRALPPLASAKFGGYPFFIPALAGHRPPQPPLDMDVYQPKGGAAAEETSGGLPRHVVTQGTAINGDQIPKEELFEAGGELPKFIAKQVHSKNANPNLTLFAKQLVKATIRPLPADGTESEKIAMQYHSGDLKLDFWGQPSQSHSVQTPRDEFPGDPRSWFSAKAYETRRARHPGSSSPPDSGLFVVNGNGARTDHGKKVYGFPGAPYANPCPANAPERTYRAAYIQFDMTVNKYGWHDPQARIAVLEEDIRDTFSYKRPAEPLFFRANSGECVTFKATNLIPSRLNLDDFQIYSPTDVLGQHIHLVKFDVTSSDGSANGWNYEDGTLSADEVRERIKAHNAQNPTNRLQLKTHPMFKLGGAMSGDKTGWCADMPGGSDENLWCGAQTSVQRWYADPLLNLKGQDRTLRTVFTHDHFGPSSHQHHGLYSALVVEPKDSRWEHLDGTFMGGSDQNGKPALVRKDGGPTSYAANIVAPSKSQTMREFNLAFADFSLLYTADLRPVNPPNRDESLLFPGGLENDLIPQPEGLSGADPGSQLINYRNEPIPLRIGQKVQKSDQMQQKRGLDGKVTAEGDMANVFSSVIHEESGRQLEQRRETVSDDEPGDKDKRRLIERLEEQRVVFNKFHLNEPWRKPGDPATPLLAAYAGDPMQVRLIQGAQEEQHIFTMQGMKWLFQPSSRDSGWMNAQQIGISEHMEFASIVPSDGDVQRDYLYASSATDNYWDGMWGLLRVFNKDQPGLHRFPDSKVTPPPADLVSDVTRSVCPAQEFKRRKIWTIGAWRAADLLADVEATDRSHFYNERFDIKDPNAIVFVQQADVSANGKVFSSQDSIAGAATVDMANRQAVLDKLQAAYKDGKVLEPLILRAPAGACMEVHLFNYLDPKDFDDAWRFNQSWEKNIATASYNMVPPIVEGLGFNQLQSSTSVGLTPQLVSFSVRNAGGANVGTNDNTLVPGCASDKQKCVESIYYWYAGDRELDKGEIVYTPAEFGAVNLQEMGDVIKHVSHGAIGALIIEPPDTTHQYVKDHPLQRGAKIEEAFYRSRAAADIVAKKSSTIQFRDFALLYQDAVALHRHGAPLENLRGGDDSEDSGGKAFNYRTEPLWARAGFINPSVSPEDTRDFDFSRILSSTAPNPGCGSPCGDPATPVFTAEAGTEVRFRILHPGGHPRLHGFTLFGHNWELMPWQSSDHEPSDRMAWNWHSPVIGSTSGIGPLRHFNIRTCAGGEFGIPGDYLYRTQESFQFQGGLWGIFHVEKSQGGSGNVQKGCRAPGYSGN